MSLTIQNPSVHTANFSGSWKNDVLNHGKIMLSKENVEEFEDGKVKLKEPKLQEIKDIFNVLRVTYLPNIISLFNGETLEIAIKKAREIAIKKARELAYRTFLQISDGFNSAFPGHFNLGENKVLIPTFTDFQNKIEGIDIHTEGGQCVKKLQALTYMPSKLSSELTLYNLFNPNQSKCDNRNLKSLKHRLESVTFDDLSSNGLSSVFMVDGESGTAHSSTVRPFNADSNLDRIIWTIISNKVDKSTIEKLIPNFQSWLEEDILRFAKSEKREENEIRETLAGYTLKSA